MTQQPQLTQTEWELVLELVEAERHDLPTELHHTDNAAVHKELQERKRVVDSLANRLKETIVV